MTLGAPVDVHEDNIVERISEVCRGVELKEKTILPELRMKKES